MEATLSPPIDDVAEIARGRLRNSPYASPRHCPATSRVAYLCCVGVSQLHHKQLAQETVRRLAGVRHIVNEIGSG